MSNKQPNSTQKDQEEHIKPRVSRRKNKHTRSERNKIRDKMRKDQYKRAEFLR